MAEQKNMSKGKGRQKTWMLVGAAIALAVLAVLAATLIKGAGKNVSVPEDLVKAACEHIEPPFWAIDCNIAFSEAYKYAYENYGAPETIVKSSLRISRQSGYYVFGFRYDDNVVCVTVSAVSEKEIKENPEACESTATS